MERQGQTQIHTDTYIQQDRDGVRHTHTRIRDRIRNTCTHTDTHTHMHTHTHTQRKTYTQTDRYRHLLTPSNSEHIARLPNNRLSPLFFTFNKI